MIDDYVTWRYGRGLIVTLIAAGFGVWLLMRGASRDLALVEGRLQMPRWFLITLGTLLQVPLVIYLVVGLYTGALKMLLPFLD